MWTDTLAAMPERTLYGDSTYARMWAASLATVSMDPCKSAQVRDTTAHSSFDLASLRTTPSAVIVHGDPSGDRTTHPVLGRVFLESALSAFMQEIPIEGLPVRFVLPNDPATPGTLDKIARLRIETWQTARRIGVDGHDPFAGERQAA